MSEEEQIPFNNRTHDRLTELEKKPCMQITRILTDQEINLIKKIPTHIFENTCKFLMNELKSRCDRRKENGYNQTQQFSKDIKELEKKLDSFKEEVIELDKKDDKRIEKLEGEVLRLWTVSEDYNDGYEKYIENTKKELSELKNNCKVFRSDTAKLVMKDGEEIDDLKNHDIFKIWSSLRRGGKTTLDAILKDNARIKELAKEIKKMKKQLDKLPRFLEVNRNWYHLNKNKEVLRELIVNMRDHASDDIEFRLFFSRLLDKLGGDTSASSASHTDRGCDNCGWYDHGHCKNVEAIVHADGGHVCWKPITESQPPRCCIPKCNEKVVFVHKNGWNFCKDHRGEERDYRAENPSEQDLAGSARQTELIDQDELEPDFPPLFDKDSERVVTIRFDLDRFKLVEKADLEKSIRILKRYGINFGKILQEKYLPVKDDEYDDRFDNCETEGEGDKVRYL